MNEPPQQEPDPRPERRAVRLAEAACATLAGTSLVLKVGVEAGMPVLLLHSVLALAACLAAMAWLAGRRGGSRIDGWRMLLCLSLFASLPQVHSRVGGDGNEYYSLARSLVFDQDLDFANDYEGLKAGRIPRTPEGLATVRPPMGLALLWIPPLLLCRLAAHAMGALGVAVDTTGFGALYQSAATATSFALVALSLLLLDGLLRRLYSPAVAGLSVLAIWLATPLHFYAVANPSMSHAASAFASTLATLAWLGARAGPAPLAWLRTGLAGGLTSLIRIQDAVLLVVPALDVALARRGWRAMAALCAGPALAASLQLGLWWLMHGAGFLSVPLGHHGGLRSEGHVLDVLLSARHGLLTWTPLYALALAGVLLWLARDARLASAALLGIASSVWINSMQWDWWGSDSFGQRRLLGLTPLLALGLAEAIALLRRRPGWMVGAGLAALVAWNQQSAYIYNSELLAPKDQAISLDRLAAAQVDVMARRVLRLEPVLPGPVFVPLYDNLRGAWLDEGPRSLGGLIELGDSEPADFPVVGHGWSGPVRAGDGTSWRFSSVQRSWLRVPVLTPASFVVSVRARAAFAAAPVSLSLEASGESVGQAPLSLDWREARFLLPARLLTPGVNSIALRWSVTPAEVVPGFRGRNAAAAVDWVRFARAPADADALPATDPDR